MIDYNIIMMDKMRVKEAVVTNEDGSYTIFINDHLHPEEKRKATAHALDHIVKEDFEKYDVDEVEFNNHHIAQHDTRRKRNGL